MTSMELNLIYEQCERIRQAVEALWWPTVYCACLLGAIFGHQVARAWRADK